jgi:hypothetical protein
VFGLEEAPAEKAAESPKQQEAPATEETEEAEASTDETSTK